MGWGGAVHDDPYQVFHSSQMAGTGDDFVQYKSQEADDAIQAARSVVDHDKDMPLWHKVCDILHQDQPYTFLYSEKELTFMDSRIHGAKPTAKNGINTPDEWYVPKLLQKYSQ
jgi:peptide/nickel transport system substrate-binding protein